MPKQRITTQISGAVIWDVYKSGKCESTSDDNRTGDLEDTEGKGYNLFRRRNGRYNHRCRKSEATELNVKVGCRTGFSGLSGAIRPQKIAGNGAAFAGDIGYNRL